MIFYLAIEIKYQSVLYWSVYMGRTKLFERADVTDKALQVFWKKGFTDTSY